MFPHHAIPAGPRSLLGVALATVSLAIALVQSDRCEAAFPGFNGKIAFVASNTIWVMGPDGSSPEGIATLSGLRNPAFSPDGTEIAFETFDISSFSSEVMKMPLDGSAITVLTNGPGQFVDNVEPAFSPNRGVDRICERSGSKRQRYLCDVGRRRLW